jgi:membrane-associated protease RseP (regulator of RpoE activity)
VLFFKRLLKWGYEKMNFDNIALLVFLFFLVLVFFLKRKDFKIHSFVKVFYIAMLRTDFGIKLIDSFAGKFRKILKKISPFMIFIGFLGMIVVVANLLYELKKIFSGQIVQSVGLVLPFEGKGIFYVPFIYWILSVVIVMVVHEAGHGIMARVWNIPVKKTGIAFLGFLIPIIPAAFVEPDEKKLAKADRKKQLSVFAAGPFANIFFAFFIFLILSFCLNPLADGFQKTSGLEITSVSFGSPAYYSGLSEGEIITSINGNVVNSGDDFTSAFVSAEIGDIFAVTTDKSDYSLVLAENPENSRRWFGVFVQENLVVVDSNFFKRAIIWVKELFFWIFLLSFGVGLFNLLPLGPIDGGKMLQISLEKILSTKKACRIWKVVGFCLLAVLLANIIPAFI